MQKTRDNSILFILLSSVPLLLPLFFWLFVCWGPEEGSCLIDRLPVKLLSGLDLLASVAAPLRPFFGQIIIR